MLPKRTFSQHKGETGVSIVADKVNNELNLIFRKVSQEYDFGIDGHIDYVTDDMEVTGGSVSIQIKCGVSYFKEETVDGYWYKVTRQHLNFLLGQSMPVFILLVDEVSRKIFWVHFNELLVNTSGKEWKILIPKENILNEIFKDYIRDLLSIGDYPQNVQTMINKKDVVKEMIPIVNSMFLKISHIEVLTLDTEGAVSFFDSLKSKKKDLKKYEGKISMILEGYENDPRELFEIPEAVLYVKKLIPQVKYWFYYMNKQHGSFLPVLLSIYCDGVRHCVQNEKGKTYIEFDKTKYKDFMEKNFLWLNEMTQFLGLPEKENKRICDEVFQALDLKF